MTHPARLYAPHPSLTDGQKAMLNEMTVDAARRVLLVLFPPSAVEATTRHTSVMPLGGEERSRICAVLGHAPLALPSSRRS